MGRRNPTPEQEIPLFDPEIYEPETLETDMEATPSTAKPRSLTSAPRSTLSAKPRQSPKKTPRISTPKVIGIATAFVLLLALSLAGYYFVERFFLRDPRFTLYGSGASSPSFHVQGAKYASAREIEEVFADDLGRSVYSIPLEDRRHHVRTVDWVRDASVARLWPNRVLVHITEREPVAFIALPSSHTGLIDADGVVMPQPQGRFDLPLLEGVRVSDSREMRRAAVTRLTRVLEALGEDAREVSEVDVADPSNTIVSLPLDGRIVKLQLGDTEFAARYAKFQQHYADIRQHMPNAKILDLRLDEFITGVDQ